MSSTGSPDASESARQRSAAARVALAMAADVGAHAAPEDGVAEVALQHAHHRGALLVGDQVEVGVGFLGRAHGAIDRMRAAQGVELERGGARVLEVVPHPPGGLPVVDDREGHPGGEGFVEPEIVPPGHRDQVAVPHVRQLVRDHLRGALALGQRRGRGIEQQQRLAEEDGAGVLHRAELEVRNRDEIELRVRVGQAEVALETGQRGARGLQRKGREAALAGDVPDPDRCRTEPDRRAWPRADPRRAPPGRSRGEASPRSRPAGGRPAGASCAATLAFEITRFARVVVTAIRKRAFIAGSSKQGKNLRASVASSWVKANRCEPERAA